MDLSVILPAFNEAEVIQPTIRKIVQFLENKSLTYELIVVDDGSTDQTAERVLALPLPGLKLLKHQANLGKGAAVQTGMLAATGGYLLFLDADYSTAIDNLDRFLEVLKQSGADIVIASRALPDSVVGVHQIKIKENLGRLGNWLIRFFLVKGIRDTQCGFKLYRRRCLSLFRKQKIKKWGFDFEILFLAQKQNYKIVELPVVWQNQPDSKVKLVSYAQTLGELFLIKYNDLLNKY